MAFESDAFEKYVDVVLEEVDTEQYRDILDNYAGDFPVSHTYIVPSQFDMDPEGEIDEREIQYKGFPAEAWIDLTGKHPKLSLNPNFYADTPEGDLTEEAKRVLDEWAAAARASIFGPPEEQPPADIEQTEDLSGMETMGKEIEDFTDEDTDRSQAA